tara:strand:+ start:16826 stop:17407 length:582 start_codon:yes stop_codon:yes gene_type:complete
MLNPKKIQIMKTLKFKSITKCLLLLLLIINFACTVEDDTSEPIKKESFRVKAVAMIASEFPSTEGNELEIYGEIKTRLTIGDKADERTLWTRNIENWVPVGSTEHIINSEGSEVTFTLTEEELNDGARIEYQAIMWDKDPDGNPDDYLGKESSSTRAIIYTELPNNKTRGSLVLKEFNGITLVVRITVEHIRD